MPFMFQRWFPFLVLAGSMSACLVTNDSDSSLNVTDASETEQGEITPPQKEEAPSDVCGLFVEKKTIAVGGVSYTVEAPIECVLFQVDKGRPEELTGVDARVTVKSLHEIEE